MADKIEVHMGNMEVVKSPGKLLSLGVGSCIVIIIYDPVKKIGALAHTMLPDSKEGIKSDNLFKYADLAVIEMIRKLESLGCKKQDMEAKLIGGANMFPTIYSETENVGHDNITAVKKILKDEGIKITAEEIGGSIGRSVKLDTETGIVTVETKI